MNTKKQYCDLIDGQGFYQSPEDFGKLVKAKLNGEPFEVNGYWLSFVYVCIPDAKQGDKFELLCEYKTVDPGK
jgi:hypothetical protein